MHPLATLPKPSERAAGAGRSGDPLSAARPRWKRVTAPFIAFGVGLGIWELMVLSGWRPDYILPGPRAVFARVWDGLASGDIADAAWITLNRALTGFTIAVACGTALGMAMAKLPWLRMALAGLLAGLQSMPSVAWFPLAIVLFQLGEPAIQYVVVLGAAPSIAVGLLSAVDHVPPLLTRVGRTMGARGFTLYRTVIFPAALPGYVAGLKQGWAFSWRSLMAGELIAPVPDRLGIGARLSYARELSEYDALLAWMSVILAVGLSVDLLLFGRIEQSLRRRRGLAEEP